MIYKARRLLPEAPIIPVEEIVCPKETVPVPSDKVVVDPSVKAAPDVIVQLPPSNSLTCPSTIAPLAVIDVALALISNKIELTIIDSVNFL